MVYVVFFLVKFGVEIFNIDSCTQIRLKFGLFVIFSVKNSFRYLVNYYNQTNKKLDSINI